MSSSFWIGFAGGIVAGIITTVIGAILLVLWSIEKSDLISTEGLPKTPVLQSMKIQDGKVFLHLKNSRRFKNVGFGRGHVDKVEVKPVGLEDHPKATDVIRVDKTELGWCEERDIEFEFRVELEDPKSWGGQAKKFTFRAFFYGPDGNELYWEGIRICGPGTLAQSLARCKGLGSEAIERKQDLSRFQRVKRAMCP